MEETEEHDYAEFLRVLREVHIMAIKTHYKTTGNCNYKGRDAFQRVIDWYAGLERIRKETGQLYFVF
jgi:hypothetical protein